LGYVRDLFQTPGFDDTVNFGQAKEHYYVVHMSVNTTMVIAAGPDLRTPQLRTDARPSAGAPSTMALHPDHQRRAKPSDSSPTVVPDPFEGKKMRS
jgi:hypothetical protein